MKKGFTLIEILITIGLLALISTVIVFSVVSVGEKQKQKEYEDLIMRIKSGSATYMELNTEIKQGIYETGDSYYIEVEKLIEAGIIDEENVVDPIEEEKVTESEKESKRKVRVHLNHEEALEYEYPSDQDDEAPECEIKKERTSDKKVELTVESKDKEDYIEYSWESATSGFGSNQTTYKTGNGRYKAYVKDSSGNVGSCEIKLGYTDTDFVAPTCVEPTNETSWSNNRTITYGCSDKGGSGCTSESTVKVELNKNTISSSTKTYTKSWTIKDKAGNETTCRATTEVLIDIAAPTCATSGASTSWATSRTITYGCSDTGGSGCATSNVSKTFTTTTKTWTIPQYTIKDKAGNTRTCSPTSNPTTINVYVDKTGPKCTYSGASTNWATSRTISWGCDDESRSGCASSGGSKTFTTTTTTWQVPAYTIKDSLGNTTTCAAKNVNIYVDKTNPSGTVAFTTSYNDNGTVTIGIKTSGVTDANSGVKSWNVKYTIGSETATITNANFSKSYTSSLSGKTISATLTVTDKVGNVHTKPISTTLKKYGSNSACGYIVKQSSNCTCASYNQVQCGTTVTGCSKYYKTCDCMCDYDGGWFPLYGTKYANTNTCLSACQQKYAGVWETSNASGSCKPNGTCVPGYETTSPVYCNGSCNTYNSCAHVNHGNKTCWY